MTKEARSACSKDYRAERRICKLNPMPSAQHADEISRNRVLGVPGRDSEGLKGQKIGRSLVQARAGTSPPTGILRMLTDHRLGLRGRAIGFCVLLLLGTVGLCSAALIYQNYRDSIRRITEHAVLYARSVSHQAEPAVLLNDSKDLQRVVQGTASNDAIRIATILSAKGKVLATFHRPGEFTPEIPVDPFHPIEGPVTHSAMRVQRTKTQLLVVVPIWPDTNEIDLSLIDEESEDGEEEAKTSSAVGFICLTYGLEQVYSELIGSIFFSGIISIVVTVVGIMVTVFMVRQLLTPVHDLAETATAIAEGDLTKRASEQAVGEIGDLARAFNHMAKKLGEYTGNLETQVQERTAELQTQKQDLESEMIVRKRAEEAAQAASRSKSEFLANMSHEIRTPMTAILGFSENLLDPGLPESDKKTAIQTIHRNGEYLLTIINDILDISKIEADKLELERIECSPMQIIADVQSLMRVRAEAKHLEFHVEYMGKIPETIRTDPTRLRQILINLIGNAIKFTDTGGVRLVARLADGGAAAQTGQTEPKMLLDIIDTGIGISPEQVDKLFQPFQQADTSTTRKFGGTGLGLTISKRLAEVLGGDVVVLDTQIGRGTCFRATIGTGPLAGVRMIEQPVSTAVLTTRSSDTSAEVASEKQLACRVLMAEDGPDNQRLISFFLKKAGAEVTVAENGQIAVDNVLAAQADGSPFDVILMDMQMPVLDGYEATGLLRRKGYTGPIIALTAHAMEEDRQKCLDAGCDDYATKPIDRKKLVKLVADYAPSGSAAAK